MRGCYHVNERVCSTQGSRWWGAVIMWMKVSSTYGSRWWGAGIVWMSEEPSDCALHMAEHRSEAGGCMLRLWAFPCGICDDVSSVCFRISPRLSAPPWKGDVRSRADVLSCRFDGWEECGHLVGMSSSPESWRSTADQRADGLSLRKCHTHLNAAEEQASGLP